MLSEIQRELRALANPKKAKDVARFFKTGPGEYGEGDVFLGLTVPQIRKIANKHQSLPLSELLKLLKSNFHEERLTALVMMVSLYRKSDELQREKIFQQYLKNRKHINNWDLVDTSVAGIVGSHLHRKSKKLLYELVKSKTLWDRRLAIVATHYFIRQGKVAETMKLAKHLLNDSEDLMHKATGWMLREAGKKDLKALHLFLQANAHRMPRTMLRYSIEKLNPKERQKYMGLKGPMILTKDNEPHNSRDKFTKRHPRTAFSKAT